MSEGEQWRVPRRLDEPARIWIFTPLEFVAVTLALLSAIVLDMFVLAIVVVGAVLFGLRHMATRFGPGWFVQFAVWYLPVSYPGVPQSWKRHWRG